MQNMPILYQNVMDSLPSEISRNAFLWASDKFSDDRLAYKAEAFAREVAHFTSALKPILEAAAKIYTEQGIGDGNAPDGLMQFILTRHANWRFGGNVKPDYINCSGVAL